MRTEAAHDIVKLMLDRGVGIWLLGLSLVGMGSCSFDRSPIVTKAGAIGRQDGGSAGFGSSGTGGGAGGTGGASATGGQGGSAGTGSGGQTGTGGNGQGGNGGSGSGGSPSLGFCQQSGHEGMACDDGLFCTTGEHCASGRCTAGSPTDCSAMNDSCNTGTCSEIRKACRQSPAREGQACDDGVFCTTGEHCTTGACIGGSPTDCSALNDQCNAGSCNETKKACERSPTREAQGCDDGMFCTTGELCTAGSCIGGSPTDCSAMNDACNAGSCNEFLKACRQQPANESGACDDGKACTSGETCFHGICSATSCAPGADCNSLACPQMCSCDVLCTGANICKASCGANSVCGFACAGAGNCEPQCDSGATCNVNCDGAGQCKTSCASSATCIVNCMFTSSKCEASCDMGSHCDIDCHGAADCTKIDCADGADCLLHCGTAGGGNGCDFKTCTNPMTCPGNVIACNRNCPM